jgi:hypothetical protein
MLRPPDFHDLDERIDFSLFHDLASIPRVKINLTTDHCLDPGTKDVRVKRVEFKASLRKSADKPSIPSVAAFGIGIKFRQARICVFLGERDTHQVDIGALFAEPPRQVDLGHVEARWVPITNIKGEKRGEPGFVGNLSHNRGAAIAMKCPKRYAVLVENWPQNAANGALLGPDLNARRLLRPAVSVVAAGNIFRIVLRIVPGRRVLCLAGLVDDPLPWDLILFAGEHESPTHFVCLGLLHRLDKLVNKELVANRPHSGRLDLARDVRCGID